LAEQWLNVALSRRCLRGIFLGTLPTREPGPRGPDVRPHDHDEEDFLHLRIEARLQRSGSEIRLVVPPDAADEPPARLDESLIKAVASRENAPEAIRQTKEFSGLCPSSSALMVKALQPGVQSMPAGGRS
jgi:hypothetical protein